MTMTSEDSSMSVIADRLRDIGLQLLAKAIVTFWSIGEHFPDPSVSLLLSTSCLGMLAAEASCESCSQEGRHATIVAAVTMRTWTLALRIFSNWVGSERRR